VGAQAADAAAERAEAEGDRSGAMLAQALAGFLHMVSGDLSTAAEHESLCRAALPFEEERADPRRLALLWTLIANSAHFRMQSDECVDASWQALRYFRLAGDSPSDTLSLLDWVLILGPRPADEALRMLDELAPGRPPGAADLPRAALLAMLGRFDEAWPLAEARSHHLRDVGDGSYAGEEYLGLIATLEGDRERACRHHAERIDQLPPGNDLVARSYWLILARDLCYLGRFDEADPLLRKSQALPLGPLSRARGPAVEALLLAERGDLEQAEALARTGVTAAITETDNLQLQAWGYEDLATVLERAGRIDDAREALEQALALWERKRCLPAAGRARERIDSLRQAQV
jgi:tetratricopeptide (TPR) repeat protein